MDRRNYVVGDGDDQSEDGQLESPYGQNDRCVLMLIIYLKFFFIHFIFNIA